MSEQLANSSAQQSELTLDRDIEMHLLSTAKWGKILGIMGLIFAIILGLVSLFLIGIQIIQNPPLDLNFIRDFWPILINVGIASYLLVASLRIVSFANKMTFSLKQRDAHLHKLSFRKLHLAFRSFGIVCIGLTVYLFIFIFSYLPAVLGMFIG